MDNTLNIEYLATLDINDLIGLIPATDNRWFELIELRKDLCPDFMGWLADNGLTASAETAKDYYGTMFNTKYADKIEAHYKKQLELMELTGHQPGFYALLEKRLRQYAGNPYTGPLGVGHFLGIKSSPDQKPKKLSDVRVAEIDSCITGADGTVLAYAVTLDDGSNTEVSVQLVCRIY